VKNYLNNFAKQMQRTPQNQPIHGSNQVQNSAGGFVWEASQWERLKRFLILGTEGGSYYVSEVSLTAENAKNLLACILEDGSRVVDILVEISEEGRAPKNEPAIFALAMVAAHGDETSRTKAMAALPTVCRTATHLFAFVEFSKGMRGWGRAMRRSIGAWYSEKEAKQIAYQVIKYRNRNGWTHTDTLRKAHPKPKGDTQKALFQWITRREEVAWKDAPASPDDEALAFVWAFERVQTAEKLKTVVELINSYDLPREALPTQWLNEAAVWEALLEKMPMTAMIRNLGNMAKSGLLKANSTAENLLVKRLTDVKALRGARIHPIALLSALRVYGGGTALHGGNRYGYYAVPKNQDWKPTAKVMDALDTAFELAFKNITSSNKRLMLAIDVSGSMDTGMVAGVAGLTPREGAGAMAMVTAHTEPNYDFVAFSTQIEPMNISAKMRLDTVVETMRKIPMGGTDCAQPMLYAMKHSIPVDAFVVYTDSESWANPHLHPVQALRDYRQKMGIMAQLIVVALVGNRFSIADPNDKGMLDVIGFDASAPTVMADFIRGDI
jgi:60 kDa SS-A/Ro ribonucleoprotein